MDIRNINSVGISDLHEQTVGWYIGNYILNPNSGNSPMPYVGGAGSIFVYFYRGGDRQMYSVLYQKSILPKQPNLLEKHGPYQTGDLTLRPVGWATVNGDSHCEFFLPEADILPGAYIRSKPGKLADIYYLANQKTLYYYHTSWCVEYVNKVTSDILSSAEIKLLKQYISSKTTQVRLC
ncbi:hypothetical protein [Mucilaginibacter jinjuensis]|uniref:Uncharacterized protein n=1 Tax=Mucilaginibacter jinjuensis TaxID=1176721 RepID=A0ABY7TAI0_9SPHI|nr:hypothetical protein [Mucilaginibacter jinjuensis]WCT13352.1 hypothetical protein PQO05_05320 [Mucilaginibacter jinjuensis]